MNRAHPDIDIELPFAFEAEAWPEDAVSQVEEQPISSISTEEEEAVPILPVAKQQFSGLYRSFMTAPPDRLDAAANAVKDGVSTTLYHINSPESHERAGQALGDFAEHALGNVSGFLRGAPEFVVNHSQKIGVITDTDNRYYEKGPVNGLLIEGGHAMSSVGDELAEIKPARDHFNGGLLSLGAETIVTTGLAIAGGALLGPLGAMALCGIGSAAFSYFRNKQPDGSCDMTKVAADGLIGGVFGAIGGKFAQFGGRLIAGGFNNVIGKLASTAARTVFGGVFGGLFAGTKATFDASYHNGVTDPDALMTTFKNNAATGVFTGAAAGAVVAPAFIGLGQAAGVVSSGVSSGLGTCFSALGRGLSSFFSGSATATVAVAPYAATAALGVGGTLAYQEYQRGGLQLQSPIIFTQR